MSELQKLKEDFYGNPNYSSQMFYNDYILELEKINKEMLDALISADKTINNCCELLNPRHVECVIFDNKQDRIDAIEKARGY